MNIPNLLTCFRMILIFPILVLFKYEYNKIALVLFFAAAVTDYIDGYLARKFKQESMLGMLLDPLADKLLYLSVLLLLLEKGYISLLPTILIIARETVAVSYGPMILIKNKKIDIYAGKVKNLLQFTSLFFVFILDRKYSDILLWLVALFTVVSVVTNGQRNER